VGIENLTNRRAVLRAGLVFLSGLFIVAPSVEARISVHFNQAQDQSYIDPYRGFSRPGDDLEKILIDHIQTAQHSIEVAVQEIRLPRLTQALIERHQSGIEVRVILENQYNLSIPEHLEHFKNDELQLRRIQDYILLADENQDGELSHDELLRADAVYMLRASGIPLIDDTADGSKGSALMHHKFVVIDGQRVLVTSANFTLSDVHGDLTEPRSRGNSNALTVIDNPEAAAAFRKEFNIMWGGSSVFRDQESRFGVNKDYRGPQLVRLRSGGQLAIQFSPTSRRRSWLESTSGLIGFNLSLAQRSVKAALFVFSDQHLSRVLEQTRLERDIDIYALVDPRFAFQYYSEVLDMLGLQMLSPNCRYEDNNSPWRLPITTAGTVRNNPGDMLHHKFAVIDDEVVIFGSKNWSASANQSNDETLLIIQQPQVAREFSKEFSRLHQTARYGASETVLNRIQEMEQNCLQRRIP